MAAVLDVYLHEAKVGRLTRDDAGQLAFRYDATYLAKGRRPISVSMPLREDAYLDPVARPYFSGLLPDERARARLASALGVSEGNAFGLLEIIGGECAGALSLLPEGQAPPPYEKTEIEALSPDRLLAVLETLRMRPLLAGEDGIRMSLAGAQDKLAVCVEDGRIGIAKGGRPTTHILKPFIEGLEGTVENELFCLRLAARLKIDVPAVSMRHVGEIPFILVERYDREVSPEGRIRRLHQEDFCQALSVPPELKYEAEGGPGTTRCLDLIQSATARPARDRLAFIRRTIFHYLVGNADAHAKNHSLLHGDAGTDLAPAYDILCTAVYPRLEKRMAMAIGGRAVPDTILLKHWLTLVPDTKVAARQLTRTLNDMAATIRREADALIAELAQEGITHPILGDIRRVIETRVTHILRITESFG